MTNKQISSEIKKRLFKIAETQMGYFTTKQAIKIGIPDANHSYHIKAGHWRREMRGIYRLVNYPVGDFEELMVWYLWSRNRADRPQGVLSHDTALDLYEISDINPSKIHISVPKSFRRFNGTPGKICLHKNDLEISDIKGFFGMKITTPIRTIADLVNEGKTAAEIVKQAVTQGLKKGLITQNQLDGIPEIRRYWKK